MCLLSESLITNQFYWENTGTVSNNRTITLQNVNKHFQDTKFK